MKTLMILSPAPVEQLETAIEEAEKLGYRVVFCSHVPYSDELVPVQSRYVIPWFDREEIVRIGQLEKIDGIFCIVDWEAPCVAEAAKILGIPHNPPESLALMNHKVGFRQLQKKANVFYPRFLSAESEEEVMQCYGNMHFPLIVKPDVSSSSRGISILYSENDDLTGAFRMAAEVSLNGKVCIEEFVRSENPLKAVENTTGAFS